MALTLWLVDRSRYEAGTGHCAWDRYLTYHAGPNGYGYARLAQSVPTVTGTLIHEPIAAILQWCEEYDRLPTDTFVYAAIRQAIETYDRLVETRGLTTLGDPEALAKRTKEQTQLLEGLVWAWARVTLPAFLTEWQVVQVETERVTVIGCTCGLGDRIGEAEAHDARECQGIGWMTRGDCIARRRQTGGLAYHDVKTASMLSANWEAAYNYRVQLIAGVLGDERVLGQTIDEVYLWPLLKGKYESTWNAEEGKASGPKFQNSPLVYGWKKAANPPLWDEEWATSFYYVGDDGKRHRLGKLFERTPLWEMDAATWAGCLSPGDYWTRVLLNEGKLGETSRVIGPIHRDDWKLESFLRELRGEERRWQETLWALHETGGVWGEPAFMAALEARVTQNRGDACHQYFGETCSKLALCERTPGWERPETIGYIARRPHHQPELEQAISRGLLPPTDGAADTVEE
jgi:hypothetical protein